jgi:protein-S-isoprenylcysteine O-methyltransferase Ste14
VVLVGATLMPLSLEVMWQADTGGTVHAQPEVVVVEHAGDRVVHGQDPYQLVDGRHATVAVARGEPGYDAYNPYLPLMSVFGLAHGTKAPRRLTDARVAFSIITILTVVAALALYWVFRPVSRPVSAVAAGMRIVYAGIFAVAVVQLETGELEAAAATARSVLQAIRVRGIVICRHSWSDDERRGILGELAAADGLHHNHGDAMAGGVLQPFPAGLVGDVHEVVLNLTQLPVVSVHDRLEER